MSRVIMYAHFNLCFVMVLKFEIVFTFRPLRKMNKLDHDIVGNGCLNPPNILVFHSPYEVE